MSEDNCLKTFHEKLELNSQIDRPSFVASSNYALDSSNMNRLLIIT